MKKMKNTILLLVASIFAQGMFGQIQVLEERNMVVSITTELSDSNQKIHDFENTSARGPLVYTNDFSNPGDWVIDGPSNMDADHTWTIGDVSLAWPGFAANGITSTSGGNYGQFNNGDPTNNMPAPIDGIFTMTTASPIDLSSNPLCELRFLQFGAKFQDNQVVLVSVDGTNFTEVGNNNDIPILSTTGGSAYPNPMMRSYNISSAIASNPSTVWIRFEWSPDVQNITYGWFVDDVEVYGLDTIDLAVDTVRWFTGNQFLQYTQIPQSQVGDIIFEASVRNNGIEAQPTTVSITGGTNLSSSEINLDPLESALVAIDQPSATFSLPSSLATYDFIYTAESANGPDENMADNAQELAVEVTEYVYAYDQGGFSTAFNNWAGNNDADARIGCLYEARADDTAYGLEVGVHENTVVDEIMIAEVWGLNGDGDWEVLEESEEYEIQASDIGSVIGIPLADPLPIFADSTYAVVVGHFGGSELWIMLDQSIEFGTIGFDAAFDGLISLADPEAAVVRLSLDPDLPIGIDEVLSEGGLSLNQNFPNPFSTETSINFELQEPSDVSISIYDASGKIVYSENLGLKNSGNHTWNFDNQNRLASGNYTYTLSSNDATLTRKMVITK